MTDIWSDTARVVSDEWIAEGKMFVGPDGYYDNCSAESELSFWDEIERRVKAQGPPAQVDP